MLSVRRVGMGSGIGAVRIRRIAVVVGVLLAAAAAAGLALWLARPLEATADANDPALVAEGHSVYDQRCASCHGARLEGQPNWRERLPSGRLPAPPHDASGHTWHHSDAQLFDITMRGAAGLLPGYQSDMAGL
jgi:Cytochrome C oxidase, cbb3-type, subunit III